MIVRLRATHRGQCAIASQRQRNAMLKPLRGQLRYGVAGVQSVIDDLPHLTSYLARQLSHALDGRW
jgi:hypothetical protein